jgi:hypothetical protein
MIMAELSDAIQFQLVNQAMRISSSFKASMTAEDLASQAATIKRTRRVVLFTYFIIAASAAAFGGILLFVANVTFVGNALGWALLAIGLIGMAVIRKIQSVLEKIMPDL